MSEKDKGRQETTRLFGDYPARMDKVRLEIIPNVPLNRSGYLVRALQQQIARDEKTLKGAK